MVLEMLKQQAGTEDASSVSALEQLFKMKRP